ncbi:hypothetical protein BpHYR1_048991, partial [Brachionus plicatilis]
MSGAADAIPIVGHVKGAIHYACGDNEGYDQAELKLENPVLNSSYSLKHGTRKINNAKKTSTHLKHNKNLKFYALGCLNSGLNAFDGTEDVTVATINRKFFAYPNYTYETCLVMKNIQSGRDQK